MKRKSLLTFCLILLFVFMLLTFILALGGGGALNDADKGLLSLTPEEYRSYEQTLDQLEWAFIGFSCLFLGALVLRVMVAIKKKEANRFSSR